MHTLGSFARHVEETLRSAREAIEAGEPAALSAMPEADAEIEAGLELLRELEHEARTIAIQEETKAHDDRTPH